MKTLQEISTFAGWNRKSMRAMADLVPLLTPAGRTSMQEMIRELESLPPVTLDASIDSTSGTVTFQPRITISATSGAVSSTTIDLYRANEAGPILQYRLLSPADGGTFGEVGMGDNGQYVIEVVRVGVQSTGSVTLKKDFSVLALQASSPPDHPSPPLVKPQITVAANGDGSFNVSGSLFLSNVTVHIRVVDDVHANDQNLNTGSDASGKFSNFKTPNLCVNRGQIYFSANDGRSDPSDLTGTLWSNTVPMTCS